MTKEEYRIYLRSEHWLDVKRRYRASGLPQACWCGETQVDLHHTTYKRLGREHLRDLTPLCRKHHDEVHGIGMPKKKRPAKKTRAMRVTKRQRRRLERHPGASFDPMPSPDEILAARTGKGAWTKAQLAIWGVRWPPPKGWRAELERKWRQHNE